MTNANYSESEKKFPELSNSIFEFDETYQKFTEFTLGSFPLKGIQEADTGRAYVVNSYGFRGPEFSKVDLVAAGCSQTFGMGVDETQTWPSLLAKSLNLTYVNIGIPGTSIQKIVESIIVYIKTYGSPKYVCVNFPSLYRYKFVLRSDVLIYPYPRHEYPQGVTQAHVSDIDMTVSPTDLETPDHWNKYSKRPYDITKTIPYEAALHMSMMSINHLIEYCSALGVHLLFTTWHPGTNLIFSEKLERVKKSLAGGDGYNKLDMSGYLGLKDLDYFFKDSHLIDCHQNKNTNNINNWHVGTDTGRHIGAHQHLHYAEMFSNEITNRSRKN